MLNGIPEYKICNKVDKILLVLKAFLYYASAGFFIDQHDSKVQVLNYKEKRNSLLKYEFTVASQFNHLLHKSLYLKLRVFSLFIYFKKK